MRERNSQIVLLIRAFEEADRDGVIVPMRARAVATRRALRVTGLADWSGDFHNAHNIRNGETISRRARLLFDSLARKNPALRGVLRVARLGNVSAPTIMALALALGLATNALGPERQINLLSVPLLGTLAWNLLIYLWWGFSRFARLCSGRHVERVTTWGRGAAEYLAELLLKAAIRSRLRAWKHLEGDDVERLRVTSRALLRFGALWQRCAGALLAARVQRLLHIGASMFALGLLGGIYIRGVALAYRVTWESTWLAADQVQGLMHWILGPAAALLGSPVPDVIPLQAPLQGDAAPWIHLFAVTIMLAVVLPRTGLALWESLRCARLATALPIDLEDGYCRRLFRDWRGGTTVVEIVPYSYRPVAKSLDLLKNLLRDYFGSRADIRLQDALDYGDEPGNWMLPVTDKGPWKPARNVAEDLEDNHVNHCQVILFNLAQPPEVEVHGTFLEELKECVGNRGDRLLVVLDGDSFERHVRDADRKTERVRAWQRIVQHAQLQAFVLEPFSDVESGLQSIARTIWPGEAGDTSEPES